MTNKLLYIFITMLAIILPACSNENESEDLTTRLTVTWQLPEGVSNGILQGKVHLLEMNTGKTYDFDIAETDGSVSNQMSVSVQQGLYNISVEGNLTGKTAGGTEDVEGAVNAYKESVSVNTAEVTVDLPLYFSNASSGFVLAEIFFAGSATPQGTQYSADKYFVIYNNSDHVLYADSLLLLESKFLTPVKEDYQPNIMSTDFAAQAVYMIPGDGKSHPVQPGGKLLICDNAQNRLLANPNSFDLRKADFEWYDESTNPYISDIDNPAIPNLERIYCYSKTLWSLHTQGFCAYALAKMATDKETFLSTDYTYEYDYSSVTPTGVPYTGHGSCKRIPNEWIIDAVNLSSEADFRWIVTAPELDRGWSYCSRFQFDDTRLGLSVRRKTIGHSAAGAAILMDTNNSTADFLPRQKADPFYKF